MKNPSEQNEKENQQGSKPVAGVTHENLSPFPFQPLMVEIEKLQGKNPSLILLYSGPDQVTILRGNLANNDPVMDMFMKHLTIDVLKRKGLQPEHIAELMHKGRDQHNQSSNEKTTTNPS